MNTAIMALEPQAQYELLDSGEEQKLERFGSILLARPDPQALWEKKLSKAQWSLADGAYVREGKVGEWEVKKNFPHQWPIQFGGLELVIRATSFKHTGLFPEQMLNWDWMRTQLTSAGIKKPRILNLFAYTGGATLVVAQAGAEVVHVDASKVAVNWAKENAELSGLGDKPIRWIVEDVMLFVKREIKRGNKYDAIIMDPPAFGHGPKDELWKIEESFVELVLLTEQLLSDSPLFVLISGYAAGYSPLAFKYNLERFQNKFGGTTECGDLAIEESSNSSKSGVGESRLLPCGIFGRWSQ